MTILTTVRRDKTPATPQDAATVAISRFLTGTRRRVNTLLS